MSVKMIAMFGRDDSFDIQSGCRHTVLEPSCRITYP